MRPYLIGILAGLVLLAAAAGGGYWWMVRRTDALRYTRLDIPLTDIRVPNDSASRAEGERVAWSRGCHGCHGDSLQGKVFLDEPRVMRLVTSNIPEAIARYSDAELARIIRHGVTREGFAALGMPSATFYHLSDLDLGRLVAYLRAAPLVPSSLPSTELRVRARLALVQGELPTDAGTMDHSAPRLGDRPDSTPVARGEYLAVTICTECHGLDLRGQDNAPALPKALGYTLPEFRSLLLDGRARDGRDLGLMGRTARRRFRWLDAGDIDAIFAYLATMSLVAQ